MDWYNIPDKSGFTGDKVYKLSICMDISPYAVASSLIPFLPRVSMADVIYDVLEQILIGLDVNDLIRCKCVCKSWRSFISSSRFVNAHLKRRYNNDRNNNEIGHRRILMSRSCRVCLSEHFYYPFDGCPFYYPFDRNNNDCDYHDNNRHLLGSSNGLVCISSFDTEVLVSNPLTREVKKLQKPYVPHMSLCWGFGYDSPTDDYKVIVGFRKGEDRTCFKVLTLKSNVWKFVGEVNYICICISRIGTLCNGGLHWLMNDQNKKKVIVSFDLSKEEFKEIPQPDDAEYKAITRVSSHPDLSLGIMDECLCVFHLALLSDNIWMMKKYNVKQSWEMVGHDFDIKDEPVYLLCEPKHDNSYVWSLRDGIIMSHRTPKLIGAPIYVQSLVSPHVHKVKEEC